MRKSLLARLSWSMPVAALATLSASCGEAARTGRSPVLLVIDTLEAASGAQPDAFGDVLFSDVETLVEQQINGQTVRVPTTYSDMGRATFHLTLKNPGSATSPTSPSALNDVTITRYRVSFRRADGRNTPGVDVPHAFDGAATVTIPASGEAAVGFAIVRHQAKIEPPLSGLQRGGGANMLSTIAEVEFYGHDQAGNAIVTTGLISVNFGDFGDPP
jgi:hypothetical protein